MLFTRRQLLTGIGGGALAIGGLTLGQRPPRFSTYTYAAPDDDTDDRRLRVAWYETYNGALVGSTDGDGTETDADAVLDSERSPGYVEEATFVTDVSGPVISVGNVLPGDTGTVVVGLEVVETEPSEPLDVWIAGSITGADEHGINEPERTDGDTTPDRGELGDDAVVEVWIDGSPLRGCDGIRNFEESLESPLVARSSFTNAFAPSTDIGGADGALALDCLDPGSLRCVALRWELPADVDNRSQGDALGFEFAFAGGPCSGDSPFGVGGSE
ncbi:hypothetical protein DP107_17845 [Haloglomus irregulare]|jgi:hypothetical protein|uniref:SipW-cognate class signal peptide n=1 Tax=Haloglomus irregulare TaxID=2234134 RepID=A0A554MUS6_9EURY|nr:hypothetical protein [Haloglomus irregulare]TSD08882.1 hypothetical protein DP107_17845 [Haloglomus irregulare]